MNDTLIRCRPGETKYIAHSHDLFAVYHRKNSLNLYLNFHNLIISRITILKITVLAVNTKFLEVKNGVQAD